MDNLDLNKYSCPNKDCSDFDLKGKGNIVITTYYGKNKTPLLRCRSCGKRFSSNKETPFFHLHLTSKTLGNVITAFSKGKSIREAAIASGISKDTAWRVLDRASKHCNILVDELLKDLNLEDSQLEDLWNFIRKCKGLKKPVDHSRKNKIPKQKYVTLPLFPDKDKKMKKKNSI